ncbi:MAG: Mur ligase family protein [Lachnospiraceae bacterium]|nr:Mur ligase family protein [Lachnospiraceae bacterium]
MSLSAEQYILSIPLFNQEKHSLLTLKHFLIFLGEPQSGKKIIHVAGTNGKGSVCAFLESILRASGVKTGLFTSPHLISMRERIRINNDIVTEEVFNAAFELIKEKIDAFRKVENNDFHPTFFEFLFLMAMVIFKDADVEYVILETGLGGRLDATNAIDEKILTVITKISFDHMEYLGATLLAIAAEKAGIMRPSVPVVSSCQEDGVTAFLREKASEYGSKFAVINNSAIKIHELAIKSIDFSFQYRYDRIVRLLLPTKAIYQTENAALAINSALLLNDERISLSSISAGLVKTVWRGRMEEIHQGVIFDGAHNEDGIKAFITSVKAIPLRGKRFLLFGGVREKRSNEIVGLLRRENIFDEIIACPLKNKRSLRIDELLILFNKEQVFTDTQSALTYLNNKKQTTDLIFITGSLYLYEEAGNFVVDPNN